MERVYHIKNSGIDSIGMQEEKGGQKFIYIMTNEIIGDNLYDINEFDAVAMGKIDIYYESILQYFHDKVLKDEEYLDDIFGPSQIVYGNKSGENDKQIFIVDIEPHYQKYKPIVPNSEPLLFVLSLASSVAYQVPLLEKKCKDGTKLIKTRKKFLKLLNKFQSTN